MRRWVIIGLLLGGAIAPAVWADDGTSAALSMHYLEVSKRLQNTIYGEPLIVQSQENGGPLNAEIVALVDYRFGALTQALGTLPNWCEFIPLHPNVKSCVYHEQSKDVGLTLYLGRKYFAAPANTHPLKYRYRLIHQTENYLSVALNAEKGPLDSRDYRIHLEAMPVDDKSFIKMRISYRPKTMSKLATTTYLATLGHNKVGFSVIGNDDAGQPIFVKGVRGIIERNVMRYFLALKAYMQNLHLPRAEQFEARINTWFDMTQGYRRQLYEMEKIDYISAKMRERGNQLVLQSSNKI